MTDDRLPGQVQRFSPRLASWIAAVVTAILSGGFVIAWPDAMVGVLIGWGILAVFLGFRMSQRCPNCGASLMQRRTPFFGRGVWIFHPIVSRRCGDCDAPL